MASFEDFANEEATKVLIELGIPANLQGYRFLRECIVQVSLNSDMLRNVTKVLYPTIGKKHNLSGGVVERSMRHATDLGFFKTGFKSLCKYFGISENFVKFKPSNSELIAVIAEHITIAANKKGIKNKQ